MTKLMTTLRDELFGRIALAPQQYHRLIIVLNSKSQPIDHFTKEMVEELGIAYVNLGLTLSHMLLELTERQRCLRLPQLVDHVVAECGDKPVFLDHIAILFSPELKQEPLRLLQGLSRNRTILAIWNGNLTNESLTYALPDHPEYRRYPIHDLNILSLLDYSA
jgi:hypothetical protein